MLHSIYASLLYCIAQLFPGGILTIRIKGSACVSRCFTPRFQAMRVQVEHPPRGLLLAQAAEAGTGTESSPGAENCVGSVLSQPWGSPLWAGMGWEEPVTTSYFWVCKHWTAKGKEQVKKRRQGLKTLFFILLWATPRIPWALLGCKAWDKARCKAHHKKQTHSIYSSCSGAFWDPASKEWNQKKFNIQYNVSANRHKVSLVVGSGRVGLFN